ncbi:hypothetical protein TKK_0009529 [Trichogramma kaykai]|uniref:DUF4371 domain-containing protein n=1 Tax=Trichogramma kaykai TaxID=54128 RepID=A0ABD2WZI8_9HYME
MKEENTENKEIFLIKEISEHIVGDKLPSNLQVLQVLFYHVRHKKTPVKDSAKIVFKEIKTFWDKAGLYIQKEQNCISKIEKLYDTWRNIQKSQHKTSTANKEKIANFEKILENLFDVSAINIFDMIDEKRKEFLLNQRKDGIEGSIKNIASTYEKSHLEKGMETSMAKKQKEERKRKMQEDWETEKKEMDERIELASSSESENFTQLSQNTVGSYSNIDLQEMDEEYIDDEPASKRKRGIKNLMTVQVVAALDRCKVSNRNAVHLFSAFAKALQYDTDELILNHTSFRKCRDKIRLAQAKKIKEIFGLCDLKAVVLHWDGKLMMDVYEHEMKDNLPVVITSGEIEQIVGVPRLDDSTGRSQAEAIYEVLADWGLLDSIKAICCDTTGTNLGSSKGAACLFEQMVDRDLLYFPCRKHIYELCLRATFETHIPGTIGPDVTIFKRFKDNWPKICEKKYKHAMDDENVKNIIEPYVSDITNFIELTLLDKQPRADYKEFLELALIFLNKKKGDVSFKFPGAMHHARWMSKGIYSLKIYLFRDHFKMSQSDLSGITKVCIFIIVIYLKAWYSCSVPSLAPNLDLKFLKSLISYRAIDQKVSEATIKKMKNHLWYLIPETAALAFFDDTISSETKRKMVKNLKVSVECEEIATECKRLSTKVNVIQLCENEMDHFINENSLKFFSRFEIEKNFLEIDPDEWKNHDDYKQGVKVVENLKIVNDTAERAIHLLQSYNNILTKNNDQKLYMIQLIKQYNEKFSNANKSTLCSEKN